MKTINVILLLLFSLTSVAQNHTANTRRNPNERSDTLTEQQIHVFSSMLENMVFVDGGTFYMGKEDPDNNNLFDNEPRHIVNLNSFFISKYEVTQLEWETVMGVNPSLFKGNNLPVENVSWKDCASFVEKINYMTGMDFRLPTEAEWEYAAKGGKYSLGYIFAGSDFLKAVAWFKVNSSNSTHEVGKKRPNELGIFDMSGNVAEWCADFYDHDYYKHSPHDNPSGPKDGINRVNRGGSWMMDELYQHVFDRNVCSPYERNASVGFRLAM